jgi:hypothetical protein
MKPRSTPRFWLALPLLALVVTGVEAAFVAGGFAYTKRLETSLLAEPKPLAAVSGKVPFASKLKVLDATGPWLHVSAGPASGWVFAGNVTETKPVETKGADGLGLSASTTTASAAARPLTPAANDYAVRRNLGDARQDLDWLNSQSQSLTTDQINAYLQAQKKGEYQ